MKKKEPYWKIFKDYHIYHNTLMGRFLKWRMKRKKRFYEKDKQGYYYIPEVSNEK